MAKTKALLEKSPKNMVVFIGAGFGLFGSSERYLWKATASQAETPECLFSLLGMGIFFWSRLSC